MQYLDTNALRAYASYLADETFIKNKFTSVLAMLELLSGIKDDKTFQLRRSIFKKLLHTNLLVDWSFPETKFLQSFGLDYNNTDISENLLSLFRLCVLTKDHMSFIQTISLNKLDEYYNLVHIYDQLGVELFPLTLEYHFATSDISQKIKDHKLRWDTNDYSALLVRIVEYHAPFAQVKSPKYSLEEIIAKYDHTIDIFLLASAFYVDQKVTSKSFPGKNDYLDLYHLIYLNSPEDQIITNDTMILRIMDKVFPGNSIKF